MNKLDFLQKYLDKKPKKREIKSIEKDIIVPNQKRVHNDSESDSPKSGAKKRMRHDSDSDVSNCDEPPQIQQKKSETPNEVQEPEFKGGLMTTEQVKVHNDIAIKKQQQTLQSHIMQS